VRKAQNAGVAVELHESPQDLTTFAELYEETMRRIDAPAFYRFPGEYWRLLAERLRGSVVLAEARFEDGELAANALFFAAQPWLHYHLSGTTERGRTAAAANLILFEAAGWAQERGFSEFHLGGGYGGREDSLFEFKVRFAPQGRREGAIGKLVHDQERYRHLGGDPGDLTGFFPAYRRPDPAEN
jgi:lipid II:glycine glycyltransferase (peptidoglycan interpeptide bridge formation enzyme)